MEPNMSYIRLMKKIDEKLHRNYTISNIPEYLSLIDLCLSDNVKERFEACKCVFYLWDWQVIDNKYLLTLFSSLAGKSKNVDAILNVFFSAVSYLCIRGDEIFLKNELPLFLKSLSSVLCSQDSAVLVVLSKLEEMESDFLHKYFIPVVYDILFSDFNNRPLIWSMLFSKFELNFQRNLLLWLKYQNIEDGFILIPALRIINVSDTEKSLHLSIILKSLLNNGQNPIDAVRMLKFSLLNTSAQTQSLVLLTLLFEIESFSKLYLVEAFRLYDWILRKGKIGSEVLWLMLVSLLPFSQRSGVYPALQSYVFDLLQLIKEKITTGDCVDMEGLTPIKSISCKYIVFRHDSLHLSYLVLRLLSKFKNDDDGLMIWLKAVSRLTPNSQIGIIYSLVGKYFLTRNSCIKKLCLTILEKSSVGCPYLYFFELLTEADPWMTNDVLSSLCRKHDSNESEIIPSTLKSLPRANEHSFNVSLSLLSEACKNGYIIYLDLNPYLNQTEGYTNVILQANLVKTLAIHTNRHFEEIIKFCNEVMNSPNPAADNGVVKSLLVDAVRTMCEKKVFDVRLIWDKFVQLFYTEHPLLVLSMVHFLAIIPMLLKHHQDEKQIKYKSARILWYLADECNNPNISLTYHEQVLRGLTNYDLDLFDATFLSEECYNHLKPSSESSPSISPISGLCWVHLIKNESLANVIIHLINKEQTKAKYRGVYSSLFEGIIQFLSLHSSVEQITQINICFKILTARWVRIPEEKDLSCLEFYLKNSHKYTKELVLYAVLNLSAMNQSAQVIIEKYLANRNHADDEKAVMCLLPSLVLGKHRAAREHILVDGVSYALSSDEKDPVTGESLCSSIEKAFTSNATSHTTPIFHRRIIMKILLSLWKKSPLNSKVFERVSNMLAVIYGCPLLRSLVSVVGEEDIKKYIFLSRQVALNTKLLRSFDINIGIRHESFQDYLIENLLFVLKKISTENTTKNLRWTLRILCMCAMSTSNFLCKVVVYGINYVSGASVLALDDSLKEHLKCFPLAVSIISKLTKKGKSVTLTMSEISKNVFNVHPVFIEAFKLGVLHIRDEPSIFYETVTKRCLD